MKAKLPYLFFVLAGSVINLIFYLKFFANTNYDYRVYWCISIIFTGITAYLYYAGFKHHKKAVIFCAVIISLFSIFCSTAGQFADSQAKINNQISAGESINKQHANLDYVWNELDRLNREWETLEAEKRATVTTAEQRYEWRNTTQAIESQQTQIKLDKLRYESMIFDKELPDTKDQYASDIFDQISSSIKQKIIIILIFEILISIIIELTAPAALYLMTLQNKDTSKPAREKKSVPEKQKEKTMRDYIIEYGNARWNGENTDILKGRPVVLEKTGMPVAVYKKITAVAVEKKLIQIDGKITKPTPFTDKKMFLDVMVKGGKNEM